MRKWTRTDARDAAYVVRYFYPDLKVKNVVVTNQIGRPKRHELGKERGKVSTKPGEYGLFINFTNVKNENFPMPYYCNGWSQCLAPEGALLRFCLSMWAIERYASTVIVRKAKLSEYEINVHTKHGTLSKAKIKTKWLNNDIVKPYKTLVKQINKKYYFDLYGTTAAVTENPRGIKSPWR